MDIQIKAVTRTMQIQYAFYITIAILLVGLYQSDLILEGTYAGDFGMQYILETIGILTTIALVPLSLKIFSVKLNKKIKMAGFENALKLYRQWSSVRLMIIAFITYLNIMIYYMTLNSIGGLCALIGLTASIFCLPGERKLREELNLVTNKEENKEEI
ncbi:hypothetical protein [uncultured Bacteroides sp.]|uniref:hypothetical protein n=1 Tax=uncultured Bacteroides sp. TaxID=162156 RepID=UPI002AA7E38A|nr:hypothetical protein [uncultured Bacteroides sp.]